MNILLIKHFFVGFMVSEIPRVSVFGHCPYSVTFPYLGNTLDLVLKNSDSDIIYGIPIKSKLLTDHFTITFRLKLCNTKIKRAFINYRNIKH